MYFLYIFIYLDFFKIVFTFFFCFYFVFYVHYFILFSFLYFVFSYFAFLFFGFFFSVIFAGWSCLDVDKCSIWVYLGLDSQIPQRGNCSLPIKAKSGVSWVSRTFRSLLISKIRFLNASATSDAWLYGSPPLRGIILWGIILCFRSKLIIVYFIILDRYKKEYGYMHLIYSDTIITS